LEVEGNERKYRSEKERVGRERKDPSPDRSAPQKIADSPSASTAFALNVSYIKSIIIQRHITNVTVIM